MEHHTWKERCVFEVVTTYIVQYIGLVRAKSEALDKIESLFKQNNIESCNAKRRRQRWRTVKNNIRSNWQKRNFTCAAHFFVHFCAFVLHDYNVKLLETSLLHVFWRKCQTSVSLTFFSLPLIFTLHWWQLAFLILSPPLQSFHVVLPKKMAPLFFFSLSFACLPPTFSLILCLSLALYSKFVDMTINLLSLIL